MIVTFIEFIFNIFDKIHNFIFNDLLRLDDLWNWYVSIFGIEKALGDVLIIALIYFVYLLFKFGFEDNSNKNR